MNIFNDLRYKVRHQETVSVQPLQVLGHHLRFVATMWLFKQWDFQTRDIKGSPSSLQMLIS